MIDKTIKEFVEEYIDSFTSWDILVYYNNNPDSKLNIDQLSVKIGRSTKDVQKSVDILKVKNILNLSEENNNLYCYQPAELLKNKIDHFIEALNNREKRMSILSIILEKGSQ